MVAKEARGEKRLAGVEPSLIMSLLLCLEHHSRRGEALKAVPYADKVGLIRAKGKYVGFRKLG
jgi:hypothetical protein